MTMTLGAITSNGVVRPHVQGDLISFIETAVFTGEYKTGGDTSVVKLLEQILSQNGTGVVMWVQVSGVPGFIFIYNYETNKLQVFDSGKEGEAFKELPEGEYPAAIRNSKPRVYVLGK